MNIEEHVAVNDILHWTPQAGAYKCIVDAAGFFQDRNSTQDLDFVLEMIVVILL